MKAGAGSKVRARGDRRAVSLFSGAGGLDLGLEASGWQVLAQVEMDADCVETLRHHAQAKRSGTTIIQNAIEAVAPRTLRRELGLDRGELELLAGGPPCQPFTTTGLRLASRDPRTVSLFPQYIEFLREFQPKTLLIENVDGMLSAALKHRPLSHRGPGHPPLASEEQKGSFLHWFLQQLRGAGYSVTWGVTEAADYGVPQFRQRAILIGSRGTEPCFLPPATHGQPGLPEFRTIRQALRSVKNLGPIQPLSARKTAVFSHVPPGGNWRDLPSSMMQATMGAAFYAEGGKSGWWRRLSWDAPSPTILGMPDHSSTGLIHPDEVRCLSVNECAALQTFPAATQFGGTPRSQYQQIGNAVPPHLAEVLGMHVSDFLDGMRQPEPAPPAWRKLSANRRIGAHGWVTAGRVSAPYRLIVKVREDHIWSGPAAGAVQTALP